MTRCPLPPTILDDDWSHAKKEATLANGLRLRYVELGTGAETLLLLHGFTSSSRTWSLVAPLLAKRYRLLLPDMRGHGDSERPLTGYDIPQLAHDAVAFLDAVGVAQAHLIGVSLGSFVAQQAAVGYPERFPTLVLVASGTAQSPSAGREWLQQQIAQLTDPIDPQFLAEWMDNPNSVDQVLHEKVGAEVAAIPKHVWQGVGNTILTHDPRPFLSTLTMPTSIIWGTLDPFFSLEEQEALQALIPNNVFKAYPGIGHNLHWEQPELLAEDIEFFLHNHTIL